MSSMSDDSVREAHGSARAAGLFFQVQGNLEEWETPYQKITLFENANFGTVLLLDGMVMTTDLDAPFYHELLVHPAVTAHPNPREVLVIGGGDGGTVTEVTRYDRVERITMVEIDQEVVKVGRKYFPDLSRGLADPRLHLRFEDGAQFMQQTDHQYDVIIVDGSDPVGPATALFSAEFLHASYQRLNSGGIFVTQSESPLYYAEVIHNLLGNVKRSYDWFGIYSSTVPTYPGALWTWTWAGKGEYPSKPQHPAPDSLELYSDSLFPRPDTIPNCVKRLMP